MKVKELMEKLSKFDEAFEVTVFAEGNVYPVLQVQEFEGQVDIGCGWDKIVD